MTKKVFLPTDVKNECLWIVRGYRRRVKAYHAARQEIIDGGGGRYETIRDPDDPKKTIRTFLPGSGGNSRTAEGKAFRLEAIERWPETKKMRAVEQAKIQIGADVLNVESRMRLMDAIMLNCESGRQFPYEYLGLNDFSRMDFYRRKNSFLVDIAIYLEMI